MNIPAPQIEVTPLMIEAGLLHLYRYDPEYGVDGEDTVRAIYLAMCAASSDGTVRATEQIVTT